MFLINSQDLFFLIPLFLIGIICSYTDIKYNKIFNKLIVSSVFYIFFLYSILYLGNYSDISNLILNGTTALIVGYFLWNLRLWSAGDAKLFAIFAFLIPLDFYAKSYIKHFPAFNLLINLFIPLLLFLIASGIFSALKNLKQIKNKLLKIKELTKLDIWRLALAGLRMFLDYLLAAILIRTVLSLKTIPGNWLLIILSNPFIVFAILILIIKSLNDWKYKNKIIGSGSYALLLIYLAVLLFSGRLLYLQGLLKTAAIFMVTIGFLRRILNFYIQEKQARKVKIKNLGPGMILTGNNFKRLLKIKKISLGQQDASGLNKEQVEIIKKTFFDNENLEIRIYQSFPFAPFLLFSSIISILTQSSFLPLLDMLFKSLL